MLSDDHKLFRCFCRYFLKFMHIFIIVVLIVVSGYVVKININEIVGDTVISISEAVLTGIIASLVVQSMNDYREIQSMKLFCKGDLLEKLKDLSMSNTVSIEDKKKTIQYIHEAVYVLNSNFIKMYNYLMVFRSFDRNMLIFLDRLEEYTRLNINNEELDEDYIDYIHLCLMYFFIQCNKKGERYFLEVMGIYTTCINTGKIINRHKSILNNANMSEEEWKDIKNFMNDLICKLSAEPWREL